MSTIKIIDINQNIKSLEGKVIQVENKDEYVIKLDENIETNEIKSDFIILEKRIYSSESIFLIIRILNSIFYIYYDKNYSNRITIYLFIPTTNEKKKVKEKINFSFEGDNLEDFLVFFHSEYYNLLHNIADISK